MVLTTTVRHERSGSVPRSHSTRFIHIDGIYAIAPARVEARSARMYRMRSHLVNEEMCRRLHYSDPFGLDGLELRFAIRLVQGLRCHYCQIIVPEDQRRFALASCLPHLLPAHSHILHRTSRVPFPSSLVPFPDSSLLWVFDNGLF